MEGGQNDIKQLMNMILRCEVLPLSKMEKCYDATNVRLVVATANLPDGAIKAMLQGQGPAAPSCVAATPAAGACDGRLVRVLRVGRGTAVCADVRVELAGDCSLLTGQVLLKKQDPPGLALPPK